jgi:hypothetical protein
MTWQHSKTTASFSLCYNYNNNNNNNNNNNMCLEPITRQIKI